MAFIDTLSVLVSTISLWAATSSSVCGLYFSTHGASSFPSIIMGALPFADIVGSTSLISKPDQHRIKFLDHDHAPRHDYRQSYNKLACPPGMMPSTSCNAYPQIEVECLMLSSGMCCHVWRSLLIAETDTALAPC